MISKIIAEDIEKIIEVVGSLLERFEGKTILITGPNGLLASYMVDTIAELNKRFKNPCKVLGLVRSDISNRDRLFHLLFNENIHFIKHDVIEPIKFSEPIDFVVHAAGRSAPAIFENDPIGTIDVNVKALRWLLDLAVEKHVKSFLYFSSGEIYGNPLSENIPTPETYNGCSSSTNLRACYTESKRCGEALCLAFKKIYNLPVKIVRPFIVYGPGLFYNDQRVMANFIKNALENRMIKMRDAGEALRSYCYIRDAVILIWKVFLSDENGEVFNIGNPKEEIKIQDLAKMIHDLFFIKEDPIHGSEKKGFSAAPDRVCPDIRKVVNKFGYEPRISLREGLKRTIDWNLEIFKNENIKN